MSLFSQLRESSELAFGRLPTLSEFLYRALKDKGPASKRRRWHCTSGGDGGENYCTFSAEKEGITVRVDAKIVEDNTVKVSIGCYRPEDALIGGGTKDKTYFVKGDWEKEDLFWIADTANECYDGIEKLKKTYLQESKIYQELNNIDFEKTSNDLPLNGEVKISPSPTADTQDPETVISDETLKRSTEMHISDVQKAAKLLADNLVSRVKSHDHTKLRFFKDYAEQFRDAKKTGQWSLDRESWLKKHHLAERHHLKHRVPEDIDLLDVLEMICDCTVAAMARSGKYHDEPFDSLVLKKAYDNTIQKLLKAIEVK